ncbi:MAG: Na/Pi cotransporter family protein [Eubacteriales bacterium]|nr:Na/Pi cotransporter family protein [Eubacteriales bacterium]MDD3349658.1 Na/Pi cotransporter family protein [Eubacteriales bacterium]
MFIILSQILGGTGLLLYGIEIMKDSLELVSQGKGQQFIETAGKNRFLCILSGLFVTAVNQKSSATTIMVVGLVNAGMLSLVQAAGVIMGANIGTTMTAQLLAFRLEFIAPLIIGVSVIAWRIAKTKRMEYTAEIFLGFGIMFIGILLMENGMASVAPNSEIRSTLALFIEMDLAKYLGLVVIGCLVTALAHSSSLTTGIMIAMCAQGLLYGEMIMPLIVGINIGKCFPALVSSRGLGRTAKRAAVIHLLFNLTGSIVTILFFREFAYSFVSNLSANDLPRQVANAHTLFNVASMVICLPFIDLLAKASDKIVPSKKDTIVTQEGNLDVRMLETPGLALAQTYSEIIRLSKMAFSSYTTSFQCVEDGDERELLKIRHMEDVILKTEREIEVYLVKLAQKKISKDQHEMLNLMLGVSSDIERISDLAINIAELAVYNRENSISFSKEAKEEMQNFHDRVEAMIAGITTALETKDPVTANKILASEIKIRNTIAGIRESHINRLSSGSCSPGCGVMYMDIINSMEHVVEHIKKMGYFLIEVSKH